MTDTTLPGWVQTLGHRAEQTTAEQLSHFRPPADGSGRSAAVLILLGDGPTVVLLERAATMRQHAGQVAFPGGAVDPEDVDSVATALREAEEEVGVDPASVQIVATLPSLFLSASSFVVTPVLGYWHSPHSIGVIDAAEVARVVVAPVAELIDPANRFTVRHPSGYVGPGFAVDGLFVWGFTAGLLNAVLDLGGWTRPWNAEVTRALPSLVGEPTMPGSGSGLTGTVQA